MTPSEYLENKKSLLDVVEKVKKREEDFLEELPVSLISIGVGFLPEFRVRLKSFVSYLSREADDFAEDILNVLGDLFYDAEHGGIFPNRDAYEIPNRDNQRSSSNFVVRKEKFAETIEFKSFCQVNYQEVVFQVHDKMKEYVYKYFPEIVDLPGDGLRRLNYDTYNHAVYFINNKFHAVVGKVFEK